MRQLIILFCCVFSIFASGNSNRFSITDLAFDPNLFTVQMKWIFDTTGVSMPLQGGISVRLGKEVSNTPNFLIYFETPLNDTTFLIPELQFDTIYTLEIWRKNENGWMAPDTNAIRTIHISSSTRQPIAFFEPGKKIDTVLILNKQVLFWKDESYPLGIPPHIDTIIRYTPTHQNLNGLKSTGFGIQFLHPEPTVPFYIGFKIDTNNINGAFTRIFTDSMGCYRTENKSLYDKNAQILYTKTSTMQFPFIVLTDTIRPRITVLSDTTSAIDIDAIIDTVLIRDNSYGVKWSFYCSSDYDTAILHPITSGILSDTSGIIYCRFPFLEFGRNGARAFLTVTDGTFYDTINLSRRSIRAPSDIISTESNTIIPLFTTVDLDSPSIRSSLKTIFQLSGGSFDKSVFRMYRWYAFDGNSGSSSKWIEATSSNEDIFTFKPSNLYWLITKQSVLFELGKGKTPSLRGNFKITLPPKNWTDFSIPFSFGIKLSDVITQSGPDSKNINYYKWDKNPTAKTYSATLLYSQLIQGENYNGITFSGESNGYTAWNPSDTAITLQFPSHVFVNENQSPSLNKKMQSGVFTVSIQGTASDGTNSRVFCSTRNNDKSQSCPQPPSFSSPCISISDNKSEKQYSILATNSIEPVTLFQLNLPNNQKGPVTLTPEIINNSLPLEFCFLKKSSSGLTYLSSSTFYINSQDVSTVYLATGEKKAIDAFHNNINHFEHSPSLFHYSYSKNRLVLQLTNSSENDLRIEFFNLQGKRVSQNTISDFKRSIELSLPQGVYVMKISNLVNGSTHYHKISIGQQELFNAQ
jgi:hypothetical protein